MGASSMLVAFESSRTCAVCSRFDDNVASMLGEVCCSLIRDGRRERIGEGGLDGSL